MREKIVGWAFGIAASLLSTYLFFETKLYAQAIISIYYAGIGVYGWMYWYKAEKVHQHISIWNVKSHVIFIAIFLMIAILSAYVFKNYTDSSSPYLDSFLTSFGFLASIKEARKILTSWVYWFVINLFSVWLYFNQHLYFYAVMMIVYAGICIPGYLSWLKIYRANKSTST
jgi:nicotinamide mononucleotide transporter